jgi:hypothetical protein
LGPSVSLYNVNFIFLILLNTNNNDHCRYINIYSATVPDRMHHLDLGLFNYQIIYTRELLKQQHGNHLVDEIDRRLTKIPKFTNLKIFKTGLQSIARLTANEYRNLMKVMIFVIDNLYKENTKNVEIFITNKDLAKVYEQWNDMYKISRYETFKQSDLNKFEVSITLENPLLFYIVIKINIIKFRSQYINGLRILFEFFNNFLHLG